MYEVVDQQYSVGARIALILERWHPLAFGVLAGYFSYRWLGGKTLGDLQQVFASTIDLGAIGLGFLITVKTILLGMRGTPAHAWVDSSGLGVKFSRLVVDTTFLVFLLVAVSLGMVLLQGLLKDGSTVIPASSAPMLARASLAIWAGACVAAGLGCFQVIRIFFLMLAPKRRRLPPPQ